MKRVRLALVLIALSITPGIVLAQTQTPNPPPTADWISSLDIYAKVFGGAVTGLGALFGLPIVILNITKTRAEIRKLELEAASLESNARIIGDEEGGISVRIHDSDNVNVQVLADPRFLGPLLLLLDFIFAWIILTLAGYFLTLVGIFGTFRSYLLGVLAALLLIPIAREARRVRSVLRPKEQSEGVEA